ncbi:MAG: hypothetical protein PHZ10_08225 [Aliarcobacter cryaerophilus]|nr:hypothetical protein [Aliarcobacter cryaerophilus]
MRKNILAAALIASLTTAAFAGSTSTTVPVTIDYVQGCDVKNIQGNYDIGVIPAVQDNSGVMMNPLSFQVACSSGLAYTIKTNSTNYAMKANGTGSTYRMEFYTDASKSTKVSSTAPWNRTGAGEYEAINLYPNVYGDTGCTYDSVTKKKICDAGSLTAAVDLIISW